MTRGKKKASTVLKAALHSFGILLTVNSSMVEKTWHWGEGGIAGGLLYPIYGFDIRGKLRIPSHLMHSLPPDTATQVPGVDLLEIAILHMEHKQNRRGPMKPSRDSTITSDLQIRKESIVDILEDDSLDVVVAKINKLVQTEIPWDRLKSLILDASSRAGNGSKAFAIFAYVVSYCTIVVNSIERFSDWLSSQSQKRPQEDGHKVLFLLRHPSFLEVRLQDPLGVLPMPRMMTRTAPVYLFVLEGEHILRNEENPPVQKKSSMLNSLNLALKQRNHLLHQMRMGLVNKSIQWLGGECTRLLERLSAELTTSESDIQGRARKYWDVWETLSLLRNTHLLAKDFVLYEVSVDVKAGHYDPNLKKPIIEQSLEIIDKRLTLLEQSTQIQLNFCQNEIQSKRETRFAFISFILSALVMFEVYASFLTWALPSRDPLGYVLWLITLAGLFVVILWSTKKAFAEFLQSNPRKDASALAPPTIHRITRRCPHCSAVYSYDSSLSKHTCQNCAKEFS